MKNASDEFVGRLVLGRYRIVGVLAKGGMGVIYLARSEGAAGFVKPVVVKRILSDIDEDNAVVSMFKREARIMSNLRHPSIVSVMDFGRDRLAYFMVLDYVHGFHLGRWVRFMNVAHGRFPYELALHIVVQVLDALHYAHTLRDEHGQLLQIVHRDVTPSNVLLDVEGHVKLADFGIARMRTDATEAGQGESLIKGKFPYLAPELLHGSEPTPVSDVYGCGVVLHEVLSGKNVFRAPSLSMTVSRVMNHIPERLDALRDDVPPKFAMIVAKALHKDPKERFQSALELADALRSLRPEPAERTQAKLAKAAARDFFDPRMAEHFDVDELSSLERLWRQRPDDTAGSFRPAAFASSSPPFESKPSIPISITDVEIEDGRGAPGPRRGFQSKRALLLAGVGVLALSVIAGVALYLGRSAKESNQTKFVYIESGRAVGDGELGASRPEPATGPQEPSGTRAAVTKPEPVAAAEPPQQHASTVKRPAPHEPAKVTPNRLEATVRKHNGKLEACFKTYPPPSGMAAVLKFQVDKDGKVEQVDLSPRAVSTGPLGQCLSKVAQAIRFGALGARITFSVPIALSRE